MNVNACNTVLELYLNMLPFKKNNFNKKDPIKPIYMDIDKNINK